jgi:hypothetical protein
MWTIPLRTVSSAVAGMVLLATGASAAVPDPTIIGPITSPGGAFVTPPSAIDLSDFGYVEEEYFVSGTARAHTAGSALGTDGKWTASPDGETAAYETRVLVRRPASPKKFNGTVVVEWLNVSGGLDAAPDWTFLHPMLKRSGYAWVGVSAQFVGVAGTGGPLGLNLSLKAVNPVRYGPLVHPGDSFSYDMFSQVGEALRHPSGTSLLGTLRPRRLIAIGESQSAFRLVTYVNAVHPVDMVYDGFLIHSRGDDGAPLSQTPQPSIGAPTPSLIRDDIAVPVLIFETETDLITLDYFPARQPDAQNVRTWETAGTAHDDAYGLSAGPGDTGVGALDTTYLPPVSSIFGVIMCGNPINAGPQHYIVSAALRRLDQWVRRGRVSGGPHSPRLQVSAGPPTSIDRDARGNALGGIRTPQVDVPIAALSGTGQSSGGFCGLFGTTVPFDAATVAGLYPSHARYVSAVERSAKHAVHAGFLIGVDAKAIVAAARASTIGN